MLSWVYPFTDKKTEGDGNMDGKTKKILNYLKKNGGEVEALDVSFGLNMDEDFVQNVLDSLAGDNLAVATRNEQGKVFYKIAEGGAAAEKESSSGPKVTPKKAKGKAAGTEDNFDEFVLENEAVNMVTDTIATHVDVLPPQAAPAKPAPAPVPAADFLVEDDFTPKPKNVKKAAPQPDIDADDDFTPKPKKKSKEKPAEIDGDISRDDDVGPKVKLPANLIAAVAAGVVILIVAVMISVSVSGGKIKSAIESAKNGVVEKSEFDTYKTETATEITKLKEENKALEDKIKNLEGKISKLDKPAAAPKKGKKR